MSDSDTAKRVIAALKTRGFAVNLGPGTFTFDGQVQVRRQGVDLQLRYPNLEFSEPPYVWLPRPDQLPRPVVPHLEESGELCVVDRARFVADRHSAPGEALGLVARAGEVLEEGLTSRAVEAIAAEFPQHFGSARVGVAFGDYEGPLWIGHDAGGYRVLERGRGPDGKVQGYAIKTGMRLSFAADQKRPDTLGELLDWARRWDEDLPKALLRAFASAGPDDPLCAIVAPNGTISVRLLISGKGSKFAATFTRSGALAALLNTKLGRGIAIERSACMRTDLPYVLGCNGGGMAPLAGKNIVLVGCGSIGGFAALGLAQLGAGLEGGSLTLLDPDLLAARNIGRHILGRDEVGRPKAETCKRLIERNLPGLAVSALRGRAESFQSMIMRADLVVDTTGEDGVSQMLSVWRIAAATAGQAPAMLHVAIWGQGAAVQSFFSSDREFACLRCLQPDMQEAHRYSPLRPDAPLEMAGGCGEGSFTPYGPSAPMMASGLACNHAVDWATGSPRPLLRTIPIDLAATRTVKPVNPPKSERCPACR